MANENCASHELKYRNRGQAAWELRKGQCLPPLRSGMDQTSDQLANGSAGQATLAACAQLPPPSIDMTSSLSTATNTASWVARSPTERKVSS